MATVLVVNHVTLDGVMQAPARADEDARDGFAHGGWATARNDQALAAKIGARMTGQLAFLFGRRTYEDFYDVWPRRPDDPMSQALTNAPIVLGTGRRLFAEGYQTELALVDGATTSTGVLLATYQTSGGVQ